jgi:3-hydroxyisobutyrate dehydrogenase-like beta-hydroxyacid dehydrogenase
LILDKLDVPRKLTLDISAITPGNLTLLEALDIAESSGVDVDEMADVIRGPQTHAQGMLVYAMAWVLARRLEPELTFAEVRTYQVELVGQAATAAQIEAEQKRAVAVASVAMLAGVSTAEAEDMTVAEVAAVTSITKARRRNARRR